MPIYEYQCKTCGHQLEAFQKFKDKPLSDCPQCGKPHLQKLISATSFQLKGGGWYATDFKNKGKEVKSGQETGDASQTANDLDASKQVTQDTTGKASETTTTKNKDITKIDVPKKTDTTAK